MRGAGKEPTPELPTGNEDVGGLFRACWGILLWRYWEQRSARDVAAAIGTTEKSVERLLARARAKFKELWLKE